MLIEGAGLEHSMGRITDSKLGPLAIVTFGRIGRILQR
jgi:hypothetical protein